MIPSSQFLEQYINPKGNSKRHRYYEDSVKFAEEMLIHFDGLPPGKLLSERRPAESEEIQKFRQIIFRSKTKSPCDKIQNALMKIRKSPDWVVKYPEQEVTRIAKDETLQQYLEVDFPRYNSFTNWFFQVGFKIYLTDTGSICLWMPLNQEKQDNEYYKPYPFVFKSSQVWDYKYSEWYFLESEEKSVFTDGKHTSEGFKFYYVDSEGIYTISQINHKGGYKIDEFKHGLSYCPVEDFGGVIVKETLDHCLRQSRVYGIVPSFDEAVREYSDLQAEVLQHIHSTFWSHAGQDCKKCKGGGFIPRKDATPIKCSECKGKGTVPVNPFEHYEIPKPKAGEPMFAGIPMGYIQKQIDIAELQDRRIRDHIKDGLSAVNMEFLIDPPQLNQSGVAKEVDKDDMHTFFHVVAEDVVRFIDSGVKINCDYRYSGIIPSEEQRKELLPNIPVPEKYDILSETYLVAEVKMLKDAGVSPSIITSAQKEYSNKKFFADNNLQLFHANILDLDPFASRNEDAILIQLMNGGVSKEDYVIHCNIESFVAKAVEEDKDFFSKTLKERKDKMKQYAKAEIKASSAQAKVIQMNPEDEEEKRAG